MREQLIIDIKNKTEKRVPFTAAEEAARDIEEQQWNDDALNRALSTLREKRNRLHVDTDYIALSDNTMSDDMKTYRTNLRDLTNGVDTVEKVKAKEFPTKP